MKSLTALIAAASLASFTTYSMAVDYSSPINADTDKSIVLQDGDSVSTDKTSIRTSGGEITLSNPEGKITVEMNSANDTYVVNASNGGNIHLGTGSTITSNWHGLNIRQFATFAASNLSLFINQEESAGNNTALLVSDGAVVNLGSGSTVIQRVSDNISATDSIRGTNISNATFTADDTFTLRIIADDDSAASIIGINASNDAQVDLGTGALIEASTALVSQTGSVITASNATITGTGNFGIGIRAGGGGTVEISNSNVSGTVNALAVAASSNASGQDSSVTISGGNLSSQTGSVIHVQHNPAHANATNSTVVLQDGVHAESETGVLVSTNAGENAANSSFDLVITGENTLAVGLVEDTSSLITHLTVSDHATWQSSGSSNMDILSLDNANIDLTLNSIDEGINVGKLEVTGDNIVNIELSNSYLLELLEGGLPQLVDLSILAGETDLSGTITYNLDTINSDGSTWDIVDMGNGQFLIDNIHVVPEPSQTALALGGVFALGFAWQRRRQQKKRATQQQ